MTRNYHILSILLIFCVATTTFAVPQSHSNVNSPSMESNGASSEQVTNDGDIQQNQTGQHETGARGKRGANWSNSLSDESNDVSSQQTGQGGQEGTQDGYGGRGQNFGQSGSNYPGSGRQNQTRGNGQQGTQNGRTQGTGATQGWNGNRRNNGFGASGSGPDFGGQGGNGQQFGNQNGFGQRGKRGANWSNSPSVESNSVSSEQVTGNQQGGQNGGYGERGVGQRGGTNSTGFGTVGNGSGFGWLFGGNGQQGQNGQRGKREVNQNDSISIESSAISSEQVTENGQHQRNTPQSSYGRHGNQQGGQNGAQGENRGRGVGQGGRSNSNGFGTGGNGGRGLGQTGSNFPGIGQTNGQQNQQFGRQNGFGGRAKRSVDQGDIQELRNLTQANAQALRTLLSALDTAQEIEVLRIVSNHSLSRDQLEAATDQWAAQQNETVQQAYQQYKQTLEQLLAEMDEIHNEVAANLTAPARAVDQQLMTILSNSSLNHSQQCQQISRILANTTQEIKRELKRTFGPLPCQHDHHGRFGGHRGRWSNSDEFGGRGGFSGGRGSPFGNNQGPFGNNQGPFGNNQGPFGQQPFQNRENRRNGFFDDSNENRFGGRNGQSGNNRQFGGRRGGNSQQPWSSGTQGSQFGQQGGWQSGRGQSLFGNNGGSGSPFSGNQQQRFGGFQQDVRQDW